MIYIAGPLFSDAERAFNAELKEKLKQFCEVYLPQEDGSLLTDLVKKGISIEDAKRIVFDEDLKAMERCDTLLIVMDGRAIDEGAAFELGYAYSSRKICHGLRTDTRREILEINNPMIEQACSIVFDSVSSLLSFYSGLSRFTSCSTESVDYSESKQTGVKKVQELKLNS